MLFCLCGCVSSGPASKVERPVVDEKYRLTADREKFAQLRAQEPDQKQVENDELAFVQQLLSDPSVSPSSVREQFDRALSKKRQTFQKDAQRQRDEFNKTERQSRERFNKSLDGSRKDYQRTKHSKEERDSFYNQMDEARKDFFDKQHDKRNDFESDMTERRKNFEDYAREKTNQFYQDLRAFQKRHDEYVKGKEAGASSTGPADDSQVKDFMQEFNEIPTGPGTSLQSGDSGQ